MSDQLARYDGLISQFLDHLERQQAQRTTADDAVTWACLPEQASPRRHAARLAVVRVFAAYVHADHPDAADPIPDWPSTSMTSTPGHQL